MIRLRKLIEKFDKKGEKTGWTFITIETKYARKLNPNSKISFRVKGKLDDYSFTAVSVLPIGNGDFILPLNGAVRKAIKKRAGDMLHVELELDKKELVLSPDLMKCLRAEPECLAFFKSLPRSHQNYFSKWIQGAKTAHTKAKRIAMAVTAFSKKQGFQEMLRTSRNQELF